MSLVPIRGLLVSVAALALAGVASAQERAVYRCPGNLYTDQLSAREAQERGCKTLDGVPVTVVQSPKRPGSGGTPAPASAAPAASRADARIDSRDQRARDSDARRILETELRKEEDRLAQLQKDYNQGEPERRGDERNYARYQERVAEMKAAIARKEADVAALRRELAKLGVAP
jgi:chromosome segregation ATPase